MDTTTTTWQRQDLTQQVNALDWVHTIDLGEGVTTPGRWAPSPLILGAMDTINFRGKKVLDIGCWDGLWSFEAERRGAAEVYATDCNSQRIFAEQPTFKLAHQLLRSNVKYYPDLSVFDVEKLGIRDFDIVLFCGVYYHLKDPLAAFARLRRVLKEGGMMIIEGEVLNGYAESFARFYYGQHHAQDPSNWWVPTVPCLREWVECSYLKVLHEGNKGPPPVQERPWSPLKRWVKDMLRRPKPPEQFSRHCLVAQAVCRRDPNYYYPDELLARFDADERRK